MHEPSVELDRLAHEVIGAAIEVHRILGPGFLERSYQRALSIELKLKDIPHTTESPVQLEYKSELIGEGRIDLLVAGQLVIELKNGRYNRRDTRSPSPRLPRSDRPSTCPHHQLQHPDSQRRYQEFLHCK